MVWKDANKSQELTGMGFVYVRRIKQAHGGELWLNFSGDLAEFCPAATVVDRRASCDGKLVAQARGRARDWEREQLTR